VWNGFTNGECRIGSGSTDLHREFAALDETMIGNAVASCSLQIEIKVLSVWTLLSNWNTKNESVIEDSAKLLSHHIQK